MLENWLENMCFSHICRVYQLIQNVFLSHAHFRNMFLYAHTNLMKHNFRQIQHCNVFPFALFSTLIVLILSELFTCFGCNQYNQIVKVRVVYHLLYRYLLSWLRWSGHHIRYASQNNAILVLFVGNLTANKSNHTILYCRFLRCCLVVLREQ